MTVHFVQTSDIHIGECRTLPGYLERHKDVLKQITAMAVEQKVPLIVAGDIFHARNTSHNERFLADWWFGDIEEKGIPTIVTTGNHDHLWDDVTQLDGYLNFPFKNITFVTWKPQLVTLLNVDYLCVPWGNVSKQQFSEIVKGFLPKMRSQYKVVIAHECIVGSKFDNGMISPKGTALPNIPEIDYWAMGDIHTLQRTNVPNGHYAGAPLQFTFGDKPIKGLLLVDLEKPTEPTFVRLRSKPMIIVKSVEEIKEDAYYMVRGEFEEVLKANNSLQVVKSEWVKSSAQSIEYQKVGILDGLPEFLAAKSLDETQQSKAVEWVKGVLHL